MEQITLPTPIKVVDPCAGGDERHPMSYPTAIETKLGIRPYTIDIREDSLADIKADYLSYWFADINRPNIIITNPPFNLAMPIIKKALDDVDDGGYVIMLLRLNFFGSDKRFDFWKEHLPIYTFVHHQRIGFIPEKSNTDSIEYAHYIWQKGNYPEFTKLKVI